VTPPEQHAAAPRPDRATVAAAATPSAATAATPPAIVRPDPLTPRVARSPHFAVTPPRSPTRSFGAPVASDLPIAGYVETAAAEVVDVPAAPAEAARGPSAPDAVTLPADSFEKLVVTDPVYPPQALRNGTTGWVELEFTITPSGSVRDIAVVEAQPRGVFEQAATTALGHWRFRPRVVNGQPVAQRSTVTMHFDVDR
jgi:protein TonB